MRSYIEKENHIGSEILRYTQNDIVLLFNNAYKIQDIPSTGLDTWYKLIGRSSRSQVSFHLNQESGLANKRNKSIIIFGGHITKSSLQLSVAPQIFLKLHKGFVIFFLLISLFVEKAAFKYIYSYF